ncbi:MAG: hypothetical protein AB8B60_13805 [Sulfitobacter sp.]
MAFYAFFDEVADDFDKDGYVLSGGISKDNLSLMKMMDIDGGFRSLLVRSHDEIHKFLKEVMLQYNALAGMNLRYERRDVSPSAENTERKDY